MPRRAQTTTERGLGREHQRVREKLLAVHIDGTPCPRCGRPMHLSQKLDAGHSVDRAVAGPHTPADRLEHRSCNRAAGQRITTAILRRRRTPGAITGHPQTPPAFIIGGRAHPTPTPGAADAHNPLVHSQTW